MTHTLYRFYARHGELLYVGITMDVASRWRDHRAGQWWWCEVGAITVRHFDTREAVLDAERIAIQTEFPTYNVKHADFDDDKRRRRQVPDYDCPTGCGRKVFYHRRTDRYFHLDGSDNLPCWIIATRGGIPELDPCWTVEIPLP